jgi:hypothetical protein
LHLIAGARHDSGMTADEVADTLLNQIIEAKYPQVLKVEKEIAKIEQDLAELLRNGEKK